MSSPVQPVQNISDILSPDDLSTYAGIAGVLRYLTDPLDPPAPPVNPSPLATGVMGDVFANTYYGLTSAGAPHQGAIRQSAGWTAFLGHVADIAAFLIQLFSLVFLPVAQLILTGLDAVRKGIDPAVGVLAVSVLNEFLGTDFTTSNLPFELGTGNHLDRARITGNLLLQQLATEFAPPGGQVVPSSAPAETFAGLAVNFGLASAIMGIAGGSIPGGFHLDEVRELGEQVAENIGLGRLVRRTLQPLVQILVANPMQWAINQQYTPTQFTLSELVNPYAQTAMDQTHLFQALNLLGYSNDKIQAIIEMHRKRLSLPDVKLLTDFALWDSPTAGAYVAGLNYPPELVDTVQLVEQLRDDRTWDDKLVMELESEVKSGNVSLEEFTAVINTMPYSNATKQRMIALATYKENAKVGKTRVAHLSYAQLKQAFEAGIVTLSDVEERWTAQGYSPDDVNTLGLLFLLDLQKVEAKAAAAAAKAAGKSASGKAPSTSPASGLVSGTPSTGTTPATGTTTP